MDSSSQTELVQKMCGEYILNTGSKAYIPLQCKIPGIGGWCWAMPPTPDFCVGDTNILVSWSQRKPFKFALAPTQNLKFALAPTPTPDASQWNIGCVGSLALGLCVGHVHFIFFVLISFALGSQRKRSFQWNMGFSLLIPATISVGTPFELI